MGYLSDQKGIFHRYIREVDSWKTHLDKTKKFIKDAVTRRKSQKIALLGSGWLLDIPLGDLSACCEEVHLYDIIHPAEVKYKIQKLENVFFYEADITGGAVISCYNIFKEFRRKGKVMSLNEISFLEFTPQKDFDLILSVNTINQLDILLVSYLKKYKIFQEDSIRNFQKLIQLSHIDMLKKNKGILITDYKEMTYDSNDTLFTEQNLLYADINRKNIRDEWIWHFDTQMTYYSNLKTYFKVLAAEF